MTRLYIQPSWIDSCSDHGEWSGGNDQYRGDKSIEAVPTYINGKPNVKAFSDEAIAARNNTKKASTVSIKDKILPQAKRLTTLRKQMVELEQEYKTTDMPISEYSVLRDVLFAKAQRAEVLYRKAIAQKPLQMPEDEAEYTPSSGFSAQDDDGYASEEYEEIGVVWIDELSNENSLKSFLKKACIITRKVIHYKHKISSYLNTLKEV